MPLLRLHDIVDEREACPNNAASARRATASANSRCPSASRQSPQAISQPIKQRRRQRQHCQHGCEYNRRCPSIICNPVRQLADRCCAGKDHVNDRKHFSAELSRRCPLNKRDDFNRRNACPHHDPCRTNRKHGEHACICAEQLRDNNRCDSKTDHRNISTYAIERKAMRPNADQATAGKTTQAHSNLNYPNAGRLHAEMLCNNNGSANR